MDAQERVGQQGNRMPQILQFSADSVCAYRLDNIPAGMHRQCITGILGIPGDKNEVAFRIELLDLFG